ncbi:MAG: hypothetical protein EP323_03675 [Gammaproteobacteria bacterium]|nr:MAG: hypothetical protein EP323_03675 [Gammaproteobacteria bacterium]
MTLARRVILCWICLLLVACGNSPFKVKNLAKTDIDMVSDAHYREVESLLRKLTVKLYKRNPRELHKGRDPSIEQRVSQIFDTPGKLQFSELPVTGIKAIELSVDPAYSGDRVFALVVGLTDMIRESYGYQTDFYLLSELDPQKLYHSARNIEIALWRIARSHDANNNPLILTNSWRGERRNLSYERLFGKLIALQDMIATIMAEKNQRVIKAVAQNVATMAFIPL